MKHIVKKQNQCWWLLSSIRRFGCLHIQLSRRLQKRIQFLSSFSQQKYDNFPFFSSCTGNKTIFFEFYYYHVCKHKPQLAYLCGERENNLHNFLYAVQKDIFPLLHCLYTMHWSLQHGRKANPPCRSCMGNRRIRSSCNLLQTGLQPNSGNRKKRTGTTVVPYGRMLSTLRILCPCTGCL